MRPPEQRWHEGESGKTHSVSLAPSLRGHREGEVATRYGLQPPIPGPSGFAYLRLWDEQVGCTVAPVWAVCLLTTLYALGP